MGNGPGWGIVFVSKDPFMGWTPNYHHLLFITNTYASIVKLHTHLNSAQFKWVDCLKMELGLYKPRT